MLIERLDWERDSFGEPFMKIGQSSVAVELDLFRRAVVFEEGKASDLRKVIGLFILVTVDFCQFDYIDSSILGLP